MATGFVCKEPMIFPVYAGAALPMYSIEILIDGMGNENRCRGVNLTGISTFAKKAVDILAGYSRVNLYLDNDTAGKETVRFFQAHHPNAVDHSSHIYPDHKDFNEFWVKTSAKNYFKYYYLRGEICPVRASYPNLPHHGLKLSGSNWNRHH